MFYKSVTLYSNNRFIKRIIRKTRKILGIPERSNQKAIISRYVKGKSFADIGALWGVNGENSFFAEENGATKVKAVDVYPESKEFLKTKESRRSKVEFIKGDINSKITTDEIGVCDTVFCAGVIYHTPDPFHILSRLRSICRETLILGTTSIPEVPGIKNMAVFYPNLPKDQRKIWNRGIGEQKAITGPYEPKEGYANWFWGMTPSCIESLLKCAGFEVVERHIFKFDSTFVCKAIEPEFVPESGEWTTTKDDEYLKFRDSHKNAK